MRLLNKSLTESIFSTLNESDDFENMVWDRISEYADPEEYFLDKLTDEDVASIAKDLRKVWENGNFEQSDLDDIMEKYAYQKYGPKEESLKEGKYVVKYWASEADRDEGFSETEYIEAKDVEDAISQTREMYYDNDWASCELGKSGDEEVTSPIFGMYPGEKTVEEERFDESVTVTAGSTYVAVDDTGVVVDDNGTTITVDGGASVNIENTDIVPVEEPVDMEAPIEGELPAEEEIPAEEPVESDESEEEIIEPSEELIEPDEDDEDKLEENAGDPNNTVEIYKNPEFDYKISDVTELDNVDVGDVRSIDMFSILNDLEESLQERYGTENWGLLNTFQTRQGKHKKTNESYASAILDISIPATKRLQELNTVLTVEVFGDKALKECVVKDARYNKKIERFCGKTKNPVKFLENVMVDLINNRAKVNLVNYQPMTEDTKELKEEVADEAYEIADLIDKRCGDRLQDGVNGERILRRDDFDEEFAIACREVLNLKDEDMDNFWGDEEGSPLKKFASLSGCDSVWDLENTVRGILGYKGYETIYETDEARNANEGDLVLLSNEPVNEDVELLVNDKYEDKGMNFADGKAIEKDVKRQENHLKQHKSLGKVTKKKFDVGKEPDQKNTKGEKVEDITDTEKVESGEKKKKSPSKKKKVEESVNEDAERIVLSPTENFGYTDPYASYYKDDNGNLYKSVSDSELYICTKAGEPLKDVDPSKYILSDKALNERTDYTIGKCEKEIQAIDSLKGFYDKVRDIVGYNDDEWNNNHGWEDHEIKYLQAVADGRYEELKGNVNESVSIIKEAKGLLDDEDDTESDVAEDSEELVDIDDELEEGATEVAIFHRKPASVEAMKQAEANGITVNKSNYKIIGTKELSGEEFDDFAKHLSSGQYSWLKDMYKAENSNSGTFNCIEVKNKDDSSMTLLVDPNGYDYARYAAIKTDLTETPEEEESEPLEEPEEELQ